MRETLFESVHFQVTFKLNANSENENRVMIEIAQKLYEEIWLEKIRPNRSNSNVHLFAELRMYSAFCTSPPQPFSNLVLAFVAVTGRST
jgi:hypothetical protein